MSRRLSNSFPVLSREVLTRRLARRWRPLDRRRTLLTVSSFSSHTIVSGLCAATSGNRRPNRVLLLAMTAAKAAKLATLFRSALCGLNEQRRTESSNKLIVLQVMRTERSAAREFRSYAKAASFPLLVRQPSRLNYASWRRYCCKQVPTTFRERQFGRESGNN